MSSLRPLRSKVAVRILPEGGSLIEAPGKSGNQVAEVLGVGPLADPVIQMGKWVLIQGYQPKVEPGDVVLVESESILAVMDHGTV